MKEIIGLVSSCYSILFLIINRELGDCKRAPKVKRDGVCSINDGFECFGKFFKNMNGTANNHSDSGHHNNGTSSTTKEIVSPVFYDLWGYPIPWTNAEWNDQKRKDLVQSTMKTKMNLEKVHQQSKSLSEYGYHLHSFYNKFSNLTKKEEEEKKILQQQESAQFAAFVGLNEEEMMNLLFPIVKSVFKMDNNKNFKMNELHVQRYTNGSSIDFVISDPSDKSLGVLVPISQDIKQDWPLTLIDSKLTKRKIHLRLGELLIYERRFVPIGRQFPLNGNMVEILSIKLEATD